MGIGVLDLFFAVCCIFYLPKTTPPVQFMAKAIEWPYWLEKRNLYVR